MDTRTVSGALFTDMIRGGTANLRKNRTVVNDLNVFPIPDGDTGDNMYMTMESGASALTDNASGSLRDVSAKAAKGMLLGARGNSGVILSRIFAGIARGFEEAESRTCADVEKLGYAFSCGITEAYGAVSVPVEGTILTVYRDAVTYANSRLCADTSLENYFDDLTEELRASLERTPDLLDVLRHAGVVDSGGAGFVYIAEGMRDAIDGKLSVAGDVPGVSAKTADISLFTEDSILEFGYCTEFLLRLQNSKVDLSVFDENVIRDGLSAMGDSLVFFRDGTVIKVHVHTTSPGDILNFCQKFGEFLTLKIENMTLQHHGSVVENRYEAKKIAPHKPYGTVAVATGKGIIDTFLSLGVDQVVNGGQSMNPSAEDFIRAFGKINADVILVYPDNGNVIMTARQAAALYDKAEIRVIPTRTVGEGYAALSMLDTSSGDTDAIAAEAEEIISGVVCGSVSRANRDTEMNGIRIHNGNYIGFSDDVVYSDSPDRAEAVLSLADRLGAGQFDILILICGADADADEAQRIYSALEGKYRRTEIIMIDGDQPVFDYMIVLE